jgi:ribosome maturation factor RimP
MENTAEGDIYGRVKKATRDLMAGLAIELVDAEIVREGSQLFLRVYIDREGGVTVDDCAGASVLISEVLEREGLMADSHVLEVMSPGTNRRFRRPEEFSKNLGKKVKVNLAVPLEGRRKYCGVLIGAVDDSFTIDIGEELLELKYEELSEARLDPELPW